MAKAILLALAVTASAQPVPESWIDALEQVETGCVSKPGDGGKAKGRFQFHRAAWDQVSKLRESQGLKTYPYSSAAIYLPAAAYAQTWLAYLRARLARATGRQPRPAEVFLAHNMGYDGFERIGFQVCRAPAARYDAAMRFEALCK